MATFRYAIVGTVGGMVQTQPQPTPILEILNGAGQYGGEVAAVVPGPGGVLHWVIKLPSQAPAQPFE